MKTEQQHARRGGGTAVHAIGMGGQLCGAGKNSIGTRRTGKLHYTTDPVTCMACLRALAARRGTDQQDREGGAIVMTIDQLLAAHAAAWWRDIKAGDFVERVNDTYAAYLAGGGSDAHYDANWRAFSDAAKKNSAQRVAA